MSVYNCPLLMIYHNYFRLVCKLIISTMAIKCSFISWFKCFNFSSTFSAFVLKEVAEIIIPACQTNVTVAWYAVRNILTMLAQSMGYAHISLIAPYVSI